METILKIVLCVIGIAVILISTLTVLTIKDYLWILKYEARIRKGGAFDEREDSD